MIVIVDDIRERVTILGFSSTQFLQLSAIIRLARIRGSAQVRRVAAELNLFVPRIYDGETGMAAVMQLTWEDVFGLNYVMMWLLELLPQPHERLIADEIVETIDAALESVIHLDQLRDRYLPG
jgi:hypothetical protein